MFFSLEFVFETCEGRVSRAGEDGETDKKAKGQLSL